MQNGKPAVYVQKGQQFLTRAIEVGKRNEEDLVVLSGLKEGEHGDAGESRPKPPSAPRRSCSTGIRPAVVLQAVITA